MLLKKGNGLESSFPKTYILNISHSMLQKSSQSTFFTKYHKNGSLTRGFMNGQKFA